MTEPPELPSKNSRPQRPSAEDGYQRFAETVGCVPSLRKKDNLVQGIVVLTTTAIGALVGFLAGSGWGALLGVLGGLVVGALGSGIVLMVLGWIRAAKSRK